MITHTHLIAGNLPIKPWLLGDGQQVCCTYTHVYMLDLFAEKGLILWSINRVVPKSCITHSIHVHNTNIYLVNMGLQYPGLLPMCPLSEFLIWWSILNSPNLQIKTSPNFPTIRYSILCVCIHACTCECMCTSVYNAHMSFYQLWDMCVWSLGSLMTKRDHGQINQLHAHTL